VHLDHKEINYDFLTFLNKIHKHTNNIFILGDLFDYWIGDDSDLYKIYEKALGQASKYLNIYFIHGNRDFLIGQEFSKKNNITLLREEELISIGDEKILLMHGDQLCTDDLEYQSLRKNLRSKVWQNNFLSKTLKERTLIANQLRAESVAATSRKDYEIMDINNNTFIEKCKNYAKIDTVIHGHTHRQKIHTYNINHLNIKRIDLGSWHQGLTYLYLDDKSGPEFMTQA
jgi:UDP-2,3-diacylglucosamine hydrolase